MPTLRDRIASWLGYEAKQPVPPGMLAELLYANPRIQTASGFRYNTNVLVQRKSMRIYDEMRKDEQIKAALALKKQFVLASGWEIASPEDEDEEYEPTAFVKDVFEDMGEAFTTSILQMLTCLDYGFSVTEKIYAYRNEDGKLGLNRLNTVAPHDIQFFTDAYGSLLEDGIRQTGNREQPNPMPADKFVIVSWQPEFGNWYGDSDLNSAHRAWLIKDQAYQWLAMLLERGGIPPALVHYDPKAIPDEIRSKLKVALQNMQAGATMLLPRGQSADSITFEWPEMAGQVATVFIPAFDMLNKDISKGLLMPGLLGLSPDNKFGSRSNGETHFDVFLLVIEYLRNLTAGAIQTQIVKELVDLNFVVGPDEYPEFRWKPISDDARLDLITAWGTLTGQNVVLSTPRDEEVIRERFKMPPREEAWSSVEDTPKPTNPNAPVIDPNNPGGAPQIDPVTGKPIPPQQNDKAPAGESNNQPPPGEGEPPPVPPKKQSRKRKAKSYALPADAMRAPTPYEMKVDFVRIESDLEGASTDYLPRLRSSLQESRDALITQVRLEFKGDLGWVNAMATLPQTDDFHATMKAMLKDIHSSGRDSIKSEVPQKLKSLPTANLDDALNYLNTKSIQVSGVVERSILDKVKQSLTQAVSTGEPLDATVQRLKDVFAPYTDTQMDGNGDLNDPYRLEAIVRTNLTDVYNMGRMLQGNQAGEFLEGWQFSAIIDSRTSDVCRMLDGTVCDADDPRADQIRPPRHISCRSVMVPITTGETIDPEDMLSDNDFTKAMEASGEGF